MSRNFNGTTSVIGLAGDSSGQANSWSFNTPQPFSWLAWIRPVNLGEGGTGRIIGCEAPAGSGVGWMIFNLQAPSTISFTIDYTNPGNVVSTATIGTINTGGVWQHVAATWNGGVATNTANLKLYVNATEVTYGLRNTSGGIFQSNTDKSLKIGNTGDATRTFNGGIAHVHIFRKALGSNEIRQVMAHPASFANLGSTSSVGTTGLIGYWGLGGFSGNEPDLSGNARVGTLSAVVIGSNCPPVNETFVVGCPMIMGAM